MFKTIYVTLSICDDMLALKLTGQIVSSLPCQYCFSWKLLLYRSWQKQDKILWKRWLILFVFFLLNCILLLVYSTRCVTLDRHTLYFCTIHKLIFDHFGDLYARKNVVMWDLVIFFVWIYFQNINHIIRILLMLIKSING